MELGNFSISLSVKDIQASKTFYEKLGFTPCEGNPDDNWVIMQNGDTTIGLFQEMFEGNILTFNPGWDNQGKETDPFTDVRELRSELRESGIETTAEENISGKGPASFMIIDPDGNPILIDQHL